MARLTALAGGALVVAALLAAPLAATTLVQMSHEEMARVADLVVVGHCTDAHSEWMGRSLVTLVTVQVTDTWKGDAGKSVTVVVPGGIDANRKFPIGQTWPDAPRLTPGQDALLFLNRRPDVDGFTVTGYSQGAFAVVADPQGHKMVSRDLRSVTLTGREKSQRGDALVAPLDQLKAEIRRALERPEREQVRR